MLYSSAILGNTHMWFLVNFHETKNSTRFKQVTPTLTVSVKKLLLNKKSNNCQPIGTSRSACLADMGQEEICPISISKTENIEKSQERKKWFIKGKFNMCSHELATDMSVQHYA